MLGAVAYIGFLVVYTVIAAVLFLSLRAMKVI
jgi:hypothetical protein